MRHAAWVLAYHGCDKTLGEAVLNGSKKELRPSQNDYDWLGSGAYFWENSYSRALKWAEFMASNSTPARTRIKQPFVIGAIIDPGECLDLCDDGCLSILQAAHERFANLMAEFKIPLPENEKAHSADQDLIKRKLDCATINFLHDIREVGEEFPFDTVRCPFTEGGPLFPGAKIHSKTHVQWCVRNPKKHVRAYFRPKAEDKF
jgi:hypothetical protein